MPELHEHAPALTTELLAEPTIDFGTEGLELFEAEQPRPEGFMARARNIGHNVPNSVSETFSSIAYRLSTRVAVGGLAATAVAALAPGIAEAKTAESGSMATGAVAAKVAEHTPSAVVAGAISRRIVIGQGIDGVNMGMNKTQVKAILGKPFGESRSRLDDTWDYAINAKGGKFKFPPLSEVGFTQSGKVDLTNLEEYGTADGIYKGYARTDKGISISSTLGQLKRAYPNVVCTPQPSGSYITKKCDIVTPTKNQTVTTEFDIVKQDPNNAKVHDSVYAVQVSTPAAHVPQA